MLREHASFVNHVAFAPDGKTLASSSADGSVKLWDANTGALVASLEGNRSSLGDLAFSPNGKTLVARGADGLRLWHVATREPIADLDAGLSQKLSSVAFSADGKTLLAGCETGEIQLWRTATEEEVASEIAEEP